MSDYCTIYYNQQGEPYIIEKNFGHDPEREGSSSNWTWHITARGVRHLCRGPFGKEQPMPRYISKEQLEDLKAYNMLRRSDGSLIGVNPLYPSDAPARPAPTARQRPSGRRPAVKRTVKPIPHPTPHPARSRRGFIGWLKTLFGRV